jgi:hypothetical protein
VFTNQVGILSCSVGYVEKKSLQYLKNWHGKHCSITRHQVLCYRRVK